jgi:hypothetical protein
MAKYRVKQYFSWGRLNLEKDQVVEAKAYEHGLLITIWGTTETILVGKGALEMMVKLGKLEAA